MDHNLLESVIKNELITILGDVGEYIMKDMKDDNRINIIVNSGVQLEIKTNISQN